MLSFLHSTEAEIFDGSSTKVVIYIVTEPVMPLAEKIKELGLQGIQRYTLLFHCGSLCKSALVLFNGLMSQLGRSNFKVFFSLKLGSVTSVDIF